MVKNSWYKFGPKQLIGQKQLILLQLSLLNIFGKFVCDNIYKILQYVTPHNNQKKEWARMFALLFLYSAVRWRESHVGWLQVTTLWQGTNCVPCNHGPDEMNIMTTTRQFISQGSSLWDYMERLGAPLKNILWN